MLDIRSCRFRTSQGMWKERVAEGALEVHEQPLLEDTEIRKAPHAVRQCLTDVEAILLGLECRRRSA